MAFDLNNWDKLSQAGLTQMLVLWGYVSDDDNLATIGTANYFDDVADHLTIDDYIYIRGSDGGNLYGVTAVSPHVTISPNPDVVSPDSIVNADINSAAAIAYSKLAALTSGNILVGSAGNVATSVTMSGDATIIASGALTIANSAITNAKVSASAAIDFAKLAALASGNILVGSAGNVATSVVMSGDATIVASGAITIGNLAVSAAKLAADAVTTAKILNSNVTLAKLASGITPSHIIKYADQETTVGGAAAEAFTVTGAAATDLAFVQIVDNGTSNVTVLQAVVTLNTLTVTFSGNPGNDTIFNYQLIRAAA